MVGGAVNRAAFSLVAAKDVQDLAGLKGRPIGVRDPEDPSGPILRRLMRALGLADPEYRVVPFPDPGVRGAAIANGTVGASFVEPSQAARLKVARVQDVRRSDRCRPGLSGRGARGSRGLGSTERRSAGSLPSRRGRSESLDLSGSDPPGGDRHPGWNAEDHGSRGGARLPTARRESASHPQGGRAGGAGLRSVLEMLEEVGALSPPLPTRPHSRTPATSRKQGSNLRQTSTPTGLLVPHLDHASYVLGPVLGPGSLARFPVVGFGPGAAPGWRRWSSSC